MLAFTQSGVVAIGGSQYAVTTAAAVDIVIPTAAQRVDVTAAELAEFRNRALAILEMWLTVEVAPVRFTSDETTATVAHGHIINVTNAPVVFIGERMILALQFINAVAANGALITYSFFFQESV
jgi:hypothetical protein